MPTPRKEFQKGAPGYYADPDGNDHEYGANAQKLQQDDQEHAADDKMAAKKAVLDVNEPSSRADAVFDHQYGRSGEDECEAEDSDDVPCAEVGLC